MYTPHRFPRYLQHVPTLPRESRKSKNINDFIVSSANC